MAVVVSDDASVQFLYGRVTRCADCGERLVKVSTPSGTRTIEYQSHAHGTVIPSADTDKFATIPVVQIAGDDEPAGHRWRFHDCARARAPRPSASDNDPTRCCKCSTPFKGDEPRYEQVSGWARVRRSGGTHGLRARRTTGRYACDVCVGRIANGRVDDIPLELDA